MLKDHQAIYWHPTNNRFADTLCTRTNIVVVTWVRTVKVGFELRPENPEQVHLECRDREVEIDRRKRVP